MYCFVFGARSGGSAYLGAARGLCAWALLLEWLVDRSSQRGAARAPNPTCGGCGPSMQSCSTSGLLGVPTLKYEEQVV